MLQNNLYHIVSLENTTAENLTAKIRLNRDHPVFEGHFPGNPILPGVCTVQIVKELLEKEVKRELMLMKAGNIKYLGFINPDTSTDVVFNISFKAIDEIVLSCSATISFAETTVCTFKAEYGPVISQAH